MAEFDKYEDNFKEIVSKAVSFSGKKPDYFMEVKVEYLLEVIRKEGYAYETLKVLDIGCGVGRTDTYLIDCFAELHGIDISEALLKKAKEINPKVIYKHFDGKTFPYESNCFDIAFVICVLHHVPSKQWLDFLREIQRVLKPGGMLLIFEHNPLNPLTLLTVNRCEFDRDAELVTGRRLKKMVEKAGLLEGRVKHILVSPFKRFLKWEKKVSGLPIGAQYYISAKKMEEK